MIQDFFNVQDIARILDIYECSAKELLDGTIDFESDELLALADAAGVTVEQLIR